MTVNKEEKDIAGTHHHHLNYKSEYKCVWKETNRQQSTSHT